MGGYTGQTIGDSRRAPAVHSKPIPHLPAFGKPNAADVEDTSQWGSLSPAEQDKWFYWVDRQQPS